MFSGMTTDSQTKVFAAKLTTVIPSDGNFGVVITLPLY